VFLRDAFRQNGYKDWQIHNVLNHHLIISKLNNTPSSVAFLPYAGASFNHFSRVMAWHNIQSVGLPHKAISSFLQPVTNNWVLGPQVYTGSRECHKVYIGQTGRCVDTRLKEHQWYIRLEYPDKSAVAEQCVNSGHHILFHNTSILATKTQHMDRFVRDAIEIELHPNNMNRDVGFCLSKSRKPIICSRKKSL
jgi:hypothetical protein